MADGIAGGSGGSPPRASTAGGSGGSPPRASTAGGSGGGPPRGSPAGGSGGSPPRASTATGRLARIRTALTPSEWRRVSGMAGTVIGLHIVGWGLLTLAVVTGDYQVSAGKAFGVGTGVLAYTFGMRH